MLSEIDFTSQTSGGYPCCVVKMSEVPLTLVLPFFLRSSLCACLRVCITVHNAAFQEFFLLEKGNSHLGVHRVCPTEIRTSDKKKKF